MKRIINLVLLFSPLLAHSQNNNIFYGGNGDGWGKANYAQPSVSTLFHGGDGDGWNKTSYSQTTVTTLFHGGDGDGWNRVVYAQASVGTMFLGGNGDGWNKSGYTQGAVSPQFYGGNGDGWNRNNYSQTYSDVAFRGGAGDGWASTYTPVAPLPVTFLKFEAVKENNTARLNWLLAQDEEVTSFDIERSHDAVSFEKIGTVNQNATNNKKYDFTDRHPFTGYNYYRLRVVGNDGKIDYTATRAVQFDTWNTSVVKIYPNPATREVNIELPQEFAADANKVLNVYGMNGAMVFQQKMHAGSASVITIQTVSFAAGSYMVHIASETKTATGKFIVTKE
ncbi:MAG TPA: T9SS type A sorting domain-containing protein [Flavipsychrobacter sp.]|nr:T9SS type A sorting domain-containing protein [Flavipsychrobacter sp.]